MNLKPIRRARSRRTGGVTTLPEWRTGLLYHQTRMTWHLNFLAAVVAVLDDGAALADGVARAAEFAAVADEVDVEGVELARGHDPVHHLVRELVGALRGDEADAAQHAEDVR